MSEQIKLGTFQKGELHPGYGKERSEETRNKIGEANSSEIIFDGVFYKSIKDASIILNKNDEYIKSKLYREEEKGNKNYKRLHKRIVSENLIVGMKPVLFNGVEYKSLTDAAQAIGKTQPRAKQIITKEISAGNPLYKYL
jgi:hypothetical protein